MTKGELEKRIIEHRIVTGQYPGQSDVLYPFWKGIPSDFLEMIDEAKKDFPMYGHNYHNYGLKKKERNRLERDAWKWFVKWFGDC